MKYILMLLLVALIGCGGHNNDKYPESTYEIKVIDGCQYIYISMRPYDTEFVLTHKGNCDNFIHQYNKPNVVYWEIDTITGRIYRVKK